ncbi:Uncharacterised protein [Achromobacter insolitus]|nr:hypothetical protein LMG6003_02782 [Achromobacter insolitus]VEG67159.1 Uncharacterised protein [Achromobacter insolitus]
MLEIGVDFAVFLDHVESAEVDHARKPYSLACGYMEQTIMHRASDQIAIDNFAFRQGRGGMGASVMSGIEGSLYVIDS